MKYVLGLATFILLNFFLVAMANKVDFSAELTRIEDSIQGEVNLKDEMKYARELRLLIKTMAESKEDQTITVFRGFEIMKKLQAKLLSKFPNISENQYNESPQSIGVILFNSNASPKLVVNILLREAKMLSVPAQILLRILYLHDVDKYKKYDKRILEFYKQQSEEGWSRGQFEYGEILLYGLGTPINKKLGLELLVASNLPKAYVTLADHYYKIDQSKYEHYLRLAAEEEELWAMYNLGVLEQGNKNYLESVKWFKNTLEIDSTYYKATFELGRMYIEGWGVERDIKKGLELIETAANHTNDEKLKEVAIKNIELIKENLRHGFYMDRK